MDKTKAKTKKKRILPKVEYTKKERLTMATLSALASMFTYFFYGPIDIYKNNMQEIPVTFWDVFPLIALTFCSTFVVLAALLYFLRGYAMNVITAAIISLFVSGIIDINFVNKIIYTSGDGTILLYNNFITSLMLYAIVMVVFISLSLILRQRWKNVIIFLCVLLFGSNMAATATDFITGDLIHDNSINCEYVVSRKGIDEVSAEKNVIVILFDRMDTKYYDEVVRQYPGYFDSLEGFTYYDSATTTYSRTFPAVTSLITQKPYLNDMTANEYFETAYPNSPFLKDLKANGYDINLYIDRYYEYNDAGIMKDYVSNVEPVTHYVPHRKKAWEYLNTLSLSRNFSYYLSLNSLNFAMNGTVTKLSDIECESGLYHDDDAAYYKELKQNGLKTNDSEKRFTFLYLHGSHGPHKLDENCELSENATVTSQTIGAFKIVFEYLDQLKKLGVYDDSTIVITADHGYAISDARDYFQVADSGITACMFVKPAQAERKPLQTSSAEISITNLVPAIVQDAKMKTNYDYGKSVFDIKEGDAQVRTLYQSVAYKDTKLCLIEYEINGDAKDLNNWTLKQRITSDYELY